MKRLILVGMLNAMLVPPWLAAQRGGGSGGGRGTGVAGRLAPPPAGPINRAPRLDGSGRNLLRGRGDSNAYDGFGRRDIPTSAITDTWPATTSQAINPRPRTSLPNPCRIGRPIRRPGPQSTSSIGPIPRTTRQPIFPSSPRMAQSIALSRSVHRMVRCASSPPRALGGQLPIGTVDRERTQQLNAAHDLKLPLPAVAAAN